jgi:hypothetical protein
MSLRRYLGFVLIMGTALLLAVVASVAAVPPGRVEVDLAEGTIIPLPGGTNEGDFCLFPVDILILTSGQTMTTFLDQSGNVVMQLSTGPLKVRVTNVATDESLDLNISGPGRIVEEGETLIATGPWLFFIPIGALDDPALQGLHLTRGRVVAEIDEMGNVLRFISINGAVEDICAALAG